MAESWSRERWWAELFTVAASFLASWCFSFFCSLSNAHAMHFFGANSPHARLVDMRWNFAQQQSAGPMKTTSGARAKSSPSPWRETSWVIMLSAAIAPLNRAIIAVFQNGSDFHGRSHSLSKSETVCVKQREQCQTPFHFFSF